MKAYKFRLAPVLQVRRVQEEQARAALARARLDAARAAQETSVRRGLLFKAREAGLPDGHTAKWRAEQDRHQRLTQAVLASRAAELRASELVTSRVSDWEQAARDLAALEKLDEKARAAYWEELLADEQREADEQAAVRHARANRTRHRPGDSADDEYQDDEYDDTDPAVEVDLTVPGGHPEEER